MVQSLCKFTYKLDIGEWQFSSSIIVSLMAVYIQYYCVTNGGLSPVLLRVTKCGVLCVTNPHSPPRHFHLGSPHCDHIHAELIYTLR